MTTYEIIKKIYKEIGGDITRFGSTHNHAKQNVGNILKKASENYDKGGIKGVPNLSRSLPGGFTLAQVFEKLEKEYKKCPDCGKMLTLEQFEDDHRGLVCDDCYYTIGLLEGEFLRILNEYGPKKLTESIKYLSIDTAKKWTSGKMTPPIWAQKLIVEKLENLKK